MCETTARSVKKGRASAPVQRAFVNEWTHARKKTHLCAPLHYQLGGFEFAIWTFLPLLHSYTPLVNFGKAVRISALIVSEAQARAIRRLPGDTRAALEDSPKGDALMAAQKLDAAVAPLLETQKRVSALLSGTLSRWIGLLLLFALVNAYEMVMRIQDERWGMAVLHTNFLLMSIMFQVQIGKSVTSVADAFDWCEDATLGSLENACLSAQKMGDASALEVWLRGLKPSLCWRVSHDVRVSSGLVVSALSTLAVGLGLMVLGKLG